AVRIATDVVGAAAAFAHRLSVHGVEIGPAAAGYKRIVDHVDILVGAAALAAQIDSEGDGLSASRDLADGARAEIRTPIATVSCFERGLIGFVPQDAHAVAKPEERDRA